MRAADEAEHVMQPKPGPAAQPELGSDEDRQAEGDAERAGGQLAPFWEEWAEQNGPEYVTALQTVRDAIGK